MRPFDWLDLVDLINLVLLAGCGFSMRRWVPLWRVYLPCIPAAVHVLFLRLGDGLQLLAWHGLIWGPFVWNYATFSRTARAEMRRLHAEMLERSAAVDAKIAELERALSKGPVP